MGLGVPAASRPQTSAETSSRRGSPSIKASTSRRIRLASSTLVETSPVSATVGSSTVKVTRVVRRKRSPSLEPASATRAA